MPGYAPYTPSRVVGGNLTGSPPAAPANVTSITKDAGATVSFLAPSSTGSGPVTSWTVTPYISGTAQAPATVAAGSAGSITGSDSNTYVQVNVTGLTNSTAYTFTARASNAYGSGPESAASGANTPLSGLVFGDDFNGPTIDPEWWVYTRCGYLAQSEVEYYLPSQVTLDGSSNLVLTAQHTSHTGPSYPSAGGGNATQPWISGSVQSNTRSYNPASGNTMTFESRLQIMADAGNGFWPAWWLSGNAYETQWKTDPNQPGMDDTTKAEIDIAEWVVGGSGTTSYRNNCYTSGNYQASASSGSDLSAAMHVYSCQWKTGGAGVSPFLKFFLDGSLTNTATTHPLAGANMFLMLYLQMLSGGPTTTESISFDYVRVYDQNLG